MIPVIVPMFSCRYAAKSSKAASVFELPAELQEELIVPIDVSLSTLTRWFPVMIGVIGLVSVESALSFGSLSTKGQAKP